MNIENILLLETEELEAIELVKPWLTIFCNRSNFDNNIIYYFYSIDLKTYLYGYDYATGNILNGITSVWIKYWTHSQKPPETKHNLLGACKVILHYHANTGKIKGVDMLQILNVCELH